MSEETQINKYRMKTISISLLTNNHQWIWLIKWPHSRISLLLVAFKICIQVNNRHYQIKVHPVMLLCHSPHSKTQSRLANKLLPHQVQLDLERIQRILNYRQINLMFTINLLHQFQYYLSIQARIIVDKTKIQYFLINTCRQLLVQRIVPTKMYSSLSKVLNLQ